jgi:iron complex transport system substrate-binding protein
VTSAELAALVPDVVVLKPCGFPIERTLGERAPVEAVLAALPTSTRVYVTDGNAFFNRPGPRLVESLAILAACVHPDRFVAEPIHRLA